MQFHSKNVPNLVEVRNRLGTLRAFTRALLPNLLTFPTYPFPHLRAHMRMHTRAHAHTRKNTLGRLGRLGRGLCLLGCKVPDICSQVGKVGK